ncbi:MAG: NifU N-terminal domain-containing protein [Candidatus Omnitrophica bacterium]|nr:NifU N-terminal domain-containing protein [Candidatus Omnitrophota bacterium]
MRELFDEYLRDYTLRALCGHPSFSLNAQSATYNDKFLRRALCVARCALLSYTCHMTDIQITTEFTPNPNSLKFNVSVPICTHGTVQFASKAEAGKSPLAAKLFEIEHVKEVMIGSDLVTVTRDEKAQSWSVLIPRVTETIREFLSCGKASPKACEKCADAVLRTVL